MSKYITTDPTLSNRLSRTANVIMLLLYLQVDNNNIINKPKFIRRSSIKLEKRTWDKYWKELEIKQVLVQSKQEFWMLSPHQCYAESASFKSLTATWVKLIKNQYG